MNTNLLPRSPVDGDHAGRDNDRVALEASAASVDTDPSGEAGPAVDDPALDEPDWYPPPGTACM